MSSVLKTRSKWERKNTDPKNLSKEHNIGIFFICALSFFTGDNSDSKPVCDKMTGTGAWRMLILVSNWRDWDEVRLIETNKLYTVKQFNLCIWN